MSGLSNITSAALPPELRDAPKAQQDRYRAALGFEQVLVQQLTKALVETAGGEGEGSAATKTYRSMLPEALADGMTAAGGLGLARTLVLREATP